MVQANLGPVKGLAQRLAKLEKWQAMISTSPLLLNASTSVTGNDQRITIDSAGVHAFNASGEDVIGMLTADGSITAYDANGNAVVHMGPLTHTSPGNYGLEIYYNGAWAQVGAGNVDWSNITNKPTSFAPSAHASTHAIGGTDPITGEVGQAQGSEYAFNNAVAGTSFFTVWVGNSTGNKFGTNTSSIRGKGNVIRHRVGPDRVLALKPVTYERLANSMPDRPYVEYGLIAEQVAETLPEIVQWMDGKIHGLRYDLLSVALLEVIQWLTRRVDALERGEKHHEPKPWHDAEIRANNPPPFPEDRLPYEIRED